MSRHVGLPYGPAFCLDGTGAQWEAARVANALRSMARSMPDDAPEAERRRECLRARAAEIDAGQYNATPHFRVIVPDGREGKEGRAVAYPCRGCRLYTFDEAWLVMEGIAARRGWSDGHPWDTSAEGRGQNLTLGIIYDGIAEPMRDVPVGKGRA